MTNWLFRHKLHHVLFWGVYFVFWTGFGMYFYHSAFLWSLLVTAIWFTGHAGSAYTCVYVLMPRFFNRKQYGWFALFFLMLWMAAALLTTILMSPVLQYLARDNAPSFGAFFSYALLTTFYTLFLFIAIKMTREKLLGERRTRLLEKERTENELRFLKSQINPHFLFNAINSIYVLIRKDPEVAAGTLARFADMLRYQLYECNTGEIPIEKEVAYLNNYIEMEKMRKGNTVAIRYNVDTQVRHFSIAPLLIIPFVENAFKYVSAYANSINSIDIALEYAYPVFKLQVENSVDPGAAASSDRVYGGIGLENVKRRLELIYNGRHTLDIQATDTAYKVQLSISTL